MFFCVSLKYFRQNKVVMRYILNYEYFFINVVKRWGDKCRSYSSLHNIYYTK